MIKATNKIVIIDNVEDDLFTLAKVFLKNGLSCKTIHYDQPYEGEKFHGIRIAFFDINLTDQAIDMTQAVYNYKTDPSLSTTYNHLANAIEDIIAEDNGPYILVFWTKNTELKDNFLDYVVERNLNIPTPCSTCCLDKGDLEHVEEKIKEIIAESPVHLLYDFEKKCTDAATKVINDIYNIIPKSTDLPWGTKDPLFEENFKKVFSCLAITKTGKETAEKYTDSSVYQILAPLLEHHLIYSPSENKWKEYLGKPLNAEYPECFDVAELNTIYHVDKQTEIDPKHRGAVFEYTPNKEKGSIPSFYLKGAEKETYDIFNRFISFKDDVSQDIISDFKLDLRFIIIEISASCDFCQNKSRNLKYLLGMLTPDIDDDNFDYNKISEGVLHKNLPVIKWNDKRYKLWIHLNYSFSNLDGSHDFGNPLFILKKELMDMIGNRYANHVSRIGISSF